MGLTITRKFGESVVITAGAESATLQFSRGQRGVRVDVAAKHGGPFAFVVADVTGRTSIQRQYEKPIMLDCGDGRFVSFVCEPYGRAVKVHFTASRDVRIVRPESIDPNQPAAIAEAAGFVC